MPSKNPKPNAAAAPAKPASRKAAPPRPPAAPPAPVPAPATVGQTLKSTRLARGHSLKEVELATRIRGKYLVAIEADRYQELPHDVYSRGFVQSYADYLGLDGGATAAAYLEQRGQQQLQLRPKRTLASSRLVLTPRLLTMVGGIIAGAAVAVYLVLQLSALTAPPKLQVTNPNKDQVLYGSLITVSGSVSDGADVYLNNSPILVDGNGNFSDPISLQNGVNSIQITAKNSLGKTTTVTRNILAHVPNTSPASALPPAPFNGVAVSIQISSRTTTVSVLVDGKQAFKGTMLPGTIQTFKGASSVTISTTDGSATNLTITNSQVVDKSLGALGNSNAPQADYEFDKDTQFQ